MTEILNAAELPQEWAISQPVWDSVLLRNIVQEPKPGLSSLQNSKISLDEPKAGPSGLQNFKRKRSDMTGAGNFEQGNNDLDFYDDHDDAIIIKEKNERLNKKYGLKEITYEAKIDINRLPKSVRNICLGKVIGLVKKLFEVLLQKCTQKQQPNDLITFCLLSDKLDKTISTGMMRVDEVTVKTFLSKIMKVLQSKEEILLDENFQIDVIIIQRLVGGARHRKILNVKVDRLTKKSIIAIESYDDFEVCCAKAILLGKAHLEKDPNLKSLVRKDGNLLLRKALALHKNAGVPEGPCGFNEITTFEGFLNIQVVVISSENMMFVYTRL